MSDYTREVEPDLTEFDLGLYRAALGTGPGKIVLDFLASQPEAPVCATHNCGAYDETCEWSEANRRSSYEDDCRLVVGRIVVLP